MLSNFSCFHFSFELQAKVMLNTGLKVSTTKENDIIG